MVNHHFKDKILWKIGENLLAFYWADVEKILNKAKHIWFSIWTLLTSESPFFFKRVKYFFNIRVDVLFCRNCHNLLKIASLNSVYVILVTHSFIVRSIFRITKTCIFSCRCSAVCVYFKFHRGGFSYRNSVLRHATALCNSPQ